MCIKISDMWLNKIYISQLPGRYKAFVQERTQKTKGLNNCRTAFPAGLRAIDLFETLDGAIDPWMYHRSAPSFVLKLLFLSFGLVSHLMVRYRILSCHIIYNNSYMIYLTITPVLFSKYPRQSLDNKHFCVAIRMHISQCLLTGHVPINYCNS